MRSDIDRDTGKFRQTANSGMQRDSTPESTLRAPSSLMAPDADREEDATLERDLQKHSKRRLTLSKYNSVPVSQDDVKKFMRDERELMKRVSRMQRGNSELDTHDFPQGELKLGWRLFNTDLHGSERNWEDIKYIAIENADECLDLRPYLITSPFICFSTDKMQKCLDIFRHNCLR